MIDPEILKISLTVVVTFATSLVTMGRWFYASIDALNIKINMLTESITALDKNLAVQTAIFNNYMEKGVCKWSAKT